MIDRVLLALQKLLMFRQVRLPTALLRYYWFTTLHKVRVWKDPDAPHLGRDTLRYNMSKMRASAIKHDRVLHMIWPLLAIEDVARNRSRMKTLSIGPRSEGELLLIAAHGFRWRNIHGIDLFSYSPRIDVGDMHNLEYADNSFDIVFSGWVLTYSRDQARALKEIVRVLKPGGYLSFGNGYDSSWGKSGAAVGADVRANDIDGLFSPIAENIDKVFFRHDIDPQQAARGERALLAVVSIKK
ncbi:MAG: class I SAM-dependent methyltransferase [Hyphomicrobiales bacterium]